MLQFHCAEVPGHEPGIGPTRRPKDQFQVSLELLERFRQVRVAEVCFGIRAVGPAKELKFSEPPVPRRPKMEPELVLQPAQRNAGDGVISARYPAEVILEEENKILFCNASSNESGR